MRMRMTTNNIEEESDDDDGFTSKSRNGAFAASILLHLVFKPVVGWNSALQAFHFRHRFGHCQSWALEQYKTMQPKEFSAGIGKSYMAKLHGSSPNNEFCNLPHVKLVELMGRQDSWHFMTHQWYSSPDWSGRSFFKQSSQMVEIKFTTYWASRCMAALWSPAANSVDDHRDVSNLKLTENWQHNETRNALGRPGALVRILKLCNVVQLSRRREWQTIKPEQEGRRWQKYS